MGVDGRIGRRISSLRVIGEFVDEGGNRLEAELVLGVDDDAGAAHAFNVDVLSPRRAATYTASDEREDELGPSVVETRPAYLLDEHDLSDEVLRREFVGWHIDEELARSLWEWPT